MKKKWLFGICTLLLACTKEDVIVQIVRNPLIQFSTPAFSWKADSYSFRSPVQVVQYPANPALSGRVYTRYVLQATGRDDKGQRLQLNLVFDAADTDRLTGEYQPTYTDERGLAAVQLYNLEPNSLAAYRLSVADTAVARITILRHSKAEGLLSGTFRVTVSNERDTSQKLQLTGGVLNDVRYTP